MRTDRVVGAGTARGMDAMVFASPAAIYYLTGAYILTQRLIPDRLAVLVVGQDFSPVLVVCNVEEDLARAHSDVSNIVTYREFIDSPMRTVAEVVAERVGGAAAIGVELNYLPAVAVQELSSGDGPCSDLRIEDCSEIFDECRMVKDEEEILILQKANLASERAIRRAFEETRMGDTERQLAQRISAALLSEGADAVGWLLVGSGETSHLVHQLPTDRVIGEGDLVRIDCGAQFDGYFTDLARTCFAGGVSEHQRRIYSALLSTQRELIDQMWVGTTCTSIYSSAGELLAAHGLPLAGHVPHVGHGIGLGIHEPPFLNPVEPRTLNAGMTLCVEPVHFASSGEMYHMEDLVLITNEGPAVLSHALDWDEPVVIGE